MTTTTLKRKAEPSCQRVDGSVTGRPSHDGSTGSPEFIGQRAKVDPARGGGRMTLIGRERPLSLLSRARVRQSSDRMMNWNKRNHSQQKGEDGKNHETRSRTQLPKSGRWACLTPRTYSPMVDPARGGERMTSIGRERSPSLQSRARGRHKSVGMMTTCKHRQIGE